METVYKHKPDELKPKTSEPRYGFFRTKLLKYSSELKVLSMYPKRAKEQESEIEKIFAEKKQKFPDGTSCLLPVLIEVKRRFGAISQESMKKIAELLKVPPDFILGTATFYSMLNSFGDKKEVYVCTGISCAMRGSEKIYKKMKQKAGNTNTVEVRDWVCLGRCEVGPVVHIPFTDKTFGNVDENDIDSIVDCVQDSKLNPQLASKLVNSELLNNYVKITENSIFTPLIKKFSPKLEDYPLNYESLKKSVSMKPDDIVEIVKQSKIRGRGGAGFLTGMKWGFIPKDAERKFLVCNADEGEPGTFKDRYLIRYLPHLVIEGIIISCYAIGANEAFVYIRGEYWEEAETFESAVEESYKNGYLGKNILGSGFSLDIRVMRGAGAYIVGEETGMLNSIEGKRGHPRPKPPFPAIKGYLDFPTCVNNVETLAAVPLIIKNGPEWFSSIGTEKSTGPKLFCISGCVKNPGLYEFPLGFSVEKFLEIAGGTRCGTGVKALIPGGSSTPPLTRLNGVTLDWECLGKYSTFLGTGALIVVCEKTCIVWLCLSLLRFYAEESCGQCTTCREGLSFCEHILHKLEDGKATMKDLDTMYDISKTIRGSGICAHIDAAAVPLVSYIENFRTEFENHIKSKGCPYGEKKSCF